MHFLIQKELGDKIYNYLVTKPFSEVEELVNGLRNIPPANIVDPEPDPVPAKDEPVLPEPESPAPVDPATPPA